MATLTINGRSVTVDDSFRNLSPEQQEATVNEIAQSLGVGSQLDPQNDDGTYGQVPDGFVLNPVTGKMEDRNNPGQEADRVDTVRGGGAFSDASNSIIQGIPFGDEIVSGLMAPVRATASAIRGEGFDIPGEYNRAM